MWCRVSAELMDALVLQCFLHALKSKVKKSELPLLTSTFLRNHMFSCWYVTISATSAAEEEYLTHPRSPELFQPEWKTA